MMRSISLLVVALVAVACMSYATQPEGASEHTKWVAQCLKEMETIKPGMKRADLLKVFTEEGGIFTRTQRRYVYRECPYIKIDVVFEPVGAPEQKMIERPEDVIVEVSKPFLEWSIAD